MNNLTSAQRYTICIVAMIAVSIIMVASIIAVTTIRSYQIHFSAYEQCMSAVNAGNRYPDVSRCNGLDNTRPKDK